MRISDVDVIIGKNLKEQRNLKRMTATELVEKIGITGWSEKSIKPSMARIENGTSPLPANLAVLIANALEIPVGELFKGVAEYTGESDVEMPTIRNFLAEDEIELIKFYRLLTVPGKRNLKEYAGYMVNDRKYNKNQGSNMLQ